MSGTKPAPMPWMPCDPDRPSLSTGVGELHRDHRDAGVALLEIRSRARQGAARADARDEDVDVALGIPQISGRS